MPVTLPNGTAGRADRVGFIRDADGDRIGAYVFEIKPDTPDNIARGQEQVQGYVDGFRAEIEAELRAAGKAVPTTAPDGQPLYRGVVVPYNYEAMMAVLRAFAAVVAMRSVWLSMKRSPGEYSPPHHDQELATRKHVRAGPLPWTNKVWSVE